MNTAPKDNASMQSKRMATSKRKNAAMYIFLPFSGAFFAPAKQSMHAARGKTQKITPIKIWFMFKVVMVNHHVHAQISSVVLGNQEGKTPKTPMYIPLSLNKYNPSKDFPHGMNKVKRNGIKMHPERIPTLFIVISSVQW